jgi:Tfp pilus assembly protein PilV
MSRQPDSLCRADSRESGVSLVEALVALAIIAALAAALAGTLADHARLQRALADRRSALLVAQSALARIEAGDRADSGSDGALTWHAAFEPYDAGGNVGAGVANGIDLPLEQVRVDVDDAAQHRLVTLRTVRIVS